MGLPTSHLHPSTRKWVSDVRQHYELEAHHDRLLLAAAETWDRLQQVREALAQHGLVYVDAYNVPRPRPEVGIERDCRIAFARLVRELDLDTQGAPSERSRPPALRSNRRLSVVSDAG